MRSSSNTEREHHDWPVALHDDDAGVLGAIVGHELDPARGLSRLGEPLGHMAKTRTLRIDGTKKNVDERVPDSVHDLEGHRASLTTAMSAPAAAAATPFRRESLSSTLETNEVEDGLGSELMLFWLSRDMMNLSMGGTRRAKAADGTWWKPGLRLGERPESRGRQ